MALQRKGLQQHEGGGADQQRVGPDVRGPAALQAPRLREVRGRLHGHLGERPLRMRPNGAAVGHGENQYIRPAAYSTTTTAAESCTRYLRTAFWAA